MQYKINKAKLINGKIKITGFIEIDVIDLTLPDSIQVLRNKERFEVYNK